MLMFYVSTNSTPSIVPKYDQNRSQKDNEFHTELLEQFFLHACGIQRLLTASMIK